MRREALHLRYKWVGGLAPFIKTAKKISSACWAVHVSACLAHSLVTIQLRESHSKRPRHSGDVPKHKVTFKPLSADMHVKSGKKPPECSNSCYRCQRHKDKPLASRVYLRFFLLKPLNRSMRTSLLTPRIGRHRSPWPDSHLLTSSARGAARPLTSFSPMALQPHQSTSSL